MASITEIAQTGSLVVAAITFLCAQYFNWRRYEHDAKQRSISATMKLLEEWRSLPMRRARDTIREQLKSHSPSLGYHKLPTEVQEQVKSVSYLCDEIAMRVVLREADEASVRAFIGDALTNLHALLRPYIETERAKNGAFQEFFTAFVSNGDHAANARYRQRLIAMFNEI